MADAMRGEPRKGTTPYPGMYTCLILVLMATHGQSQRNTATSDVEIDPAPLKQMMEGSNHILTWFSNISTIARVTASVEEEMVLDIALVGRVMEGEAGDNATFYGHVNVSALFIGYSEVYLKFYSDLDVIVADKTVPASVVLSYQKINDIFIILLSILIAFAYVNMGATMDMNVVKGLTKKPVGPVLGVICQYIFMPLIAFGLGKLVFPGNPMAQLGMFLSGSSPGGGTSNMWTHLLGGSLDLSIIMTFFSTVIAFGSVPLWVYLMGPLILDETDFVIPYKDIAVIVVSLAVPCCIGIIIRKCLPRVAKFLKSMLTPISIFNLVFTFTFGIYANRYIFAYFTPKTILIAFLSPFLGYLSGLILAKIFCQTNKDIIAISIETGIQNNTIAFLILKLTFDRPAGDITAVFPCAAVIMAPIPLILAIIGRRLYEHCFRSKSQDFSDKDAKKSIENGNTMKDVENPSKKQAPTSEANGVKATNNKEGLDNPAADLNDEAA